MIIFGKKKQSNNDNPVFGMPENLFVIHLAGGWPFPNSGYLYRIYQIYIMCSLSYQTIGELIYGYVHLDNIRLTLMSLMLVLSFLKGVLKLLFMNIHYKRVNHIFESFRMAYYNFAPHCKKEKKDEFQKINKNLKSDFLKYIVICLSTSTIWSMNGFFENASKEDHQLQRIEIEDFTFKFGIEIWLPFVIRSRAQFFIIYILLFINFQAMCCIFGGIDTLRVSLLRYLSGHLRILAKEIEKSKECPIHSMETNLIECVRYHREILRIAGEIEIVIGIEFFFQCFIFTLLFGTCGAISTGTFDSYAAKIFIIAFVVMVQIYIIISAADDTYQDLQSIDFVGYSAPWIDESKSVKYLLKFIMLKSCLVKPLQASSFLTVTNETFAMLLNSAFTYITVLNNISA